MHIFIVLLIVVFVFQKFDIFLSKHGIHLILFFVRFYLPRGSCFYLAGDGEGETILGIFLCIIYFILLYTHLYIFICISSYLFIYL